MSAEEKIFLNVPYAEKDRAKQLGAKWDKTERGWWIGAGTDREAFGPWLPVRYHPRARPPYIVADMVPAPTWYMNLRSFLPKEEWDRLRRDCYEQAGKRCRVCGGRGPKWPVECDEQWEYIEDTGTPGVGVQKLAGLAALCPDCHIVKHLGKANIDGKLDQALRHLGFINGWTSQEVNAHYQAAGEDWERRSEMDWHFDLSLLPSLGIESLKINKYDYGFVPIIQGVGVQLLDTLSSLFNRGARGVMLRFNDAARPC